MKTHYRFVFVAGVSLLIHFLILLGISLNKISLSQENTPLVIHLKDYEKPRKKINSENNGSPLSKLKDKNRQTTKRADTSLPTRKKTIDRNENTATLDLNTQTITPKYSQYAGKSPPKLSGIEILGRSIDLIRNPPQQNETVDSQLSAVQKKNLLNLHAVRTNSRAINDYVTADGKVRLSFATEGGHIICAEIKPKDNLNDLDWTTWTNYTIGCTK